MSTLDHTGIEDPGDTDTSAQDSRFSRRLVTAVAATTALVLVAALAFAVVMFLRHRDVDRQVRAQADAQAAADSFVLAMDDVNGAKFDAYIARVNSLLTTKAKTKNIQGLKALKTVYEKGKVSGTGKVLASGVGDADLDSATVLVVHDTDVTSTAGEVKHHYRWTVSMEKIGGKWLVDDFTPTTGGTS